jgi:hypothetical protein
MNLDANSPAHGVAKTRHARLEVFDLAIQNGAN